MVRSSLKNPPVIVKTTHGSCLLPATTQTYVEIAPGTYVKKEAAHIQPGDFVLYQKDSINTTMAEVHPQLMTSERYKSAHESLHLADGNHTTTRLRAFLVRAIYSYAHGQPEQSKSLEERLEEKIVVKTEDFSDDEYKKMITYIGDILRKQNVPHADSTIKEWLQGHTLLPNNKKVLTAIAQETKHSSLESLAQKSVAENHRLYSIIRSGIMRYLSSGGQHAIEHEINGENSGQTKLTKQSLSLRPEIAIIMRKFGHSIDKNYAAAAVSEVQKVTLTDSGRTQHTKTTDDHLVTGIVTRHPKDFSGTVVTPANIHVDFQLLEGILAPALGRLCASGAYPQIYASVVEYLEKCYQYKHMARNVHQIGNLIKVAYDRRVHNGTRLAKTQYAQKLDSSATDIVDPIILDIIEGTADEYIQHYVLQDQSFAPHTINNGVNAYITLSVSTHPRVAELISQLNSLRIPATNPSKRKAIEQQARGTRNLLTNFGIHERIKKGYSLCGQIDIMSKDNPTMDEQEILDSEKFRQLRQNSRTEEQYMTADDAANYLRKYGAQDLVKIVDPRYFVA